MTDDRIDQAASVVNGTMHQGDGGRQAREMLAFDANTMGRADYNAMVQQVTTTEALNINELMRQGRHDDALSLLREDSNIFLNHDQFMGLADEVRAMNKATHAPTHLEFNPIYQNGDQYGRPTAVEVDMATTFRSQQTGQQWEKRDVVARVDNHMGPGDMQPIPPPQVVIAEPPPRVIVEGDNRGGGFNFNLEIEIGRERMQRHDPRWCPDRDWRPSNAPPGFNLEIEIGRTREEHNRRGDRDWSPQRPTNQTIINQINNTTIINNTTNNRTDSHDRNTGNDRSRTRVINEAPPAPIGQQPRPGQRIEVPPTQRREVPPLIGQQPRTDVPPTTQPLPHRNDVPANQPLPHRDMPIGRERPDAQTPEQRRDAAQQRRDEAIQRREDAQNRQGQDRVPPQRREQEDPRRRDNDDDRDKKEKKKN